MAFDGTAEYNYGELTTHVQELCKLIILYSVLFSKLQTKIMAKQLRVWISTFTIPEKACIVSEYTQTLSIIWTKCYACGLLQKSPPHRSDTTWPEQSLLETENIGHRGKNGGPGTSGETIQKVRQFLHNGSTHSIGDDFSRSQLSTTIHRILCKWLFSVALTAFESSEPLNEADQKWLDLIGNSFTKQEVYAKYLGKVIFLINACLASMVSSRSKT